MADWTRFFEQLECKVGNEIAASEWFLIDQRTTDVYAALIGDLDPFHNDPSWDGLAEWGGTVIVGTNGLSMIPTFLHEYGFPLSADPDVEFAPIRLNKVRFVSPLLVGKRARDRATLVELRRDGPGGWLVTTNHTVEIEGSDRPFMSAEFVGRYTVRSH